MEKSEREEEESRVRKSEMEVDGERGMGVGGLKRVGAPEGNRSKRWERLKMSHGGFSSFHPPRLISYHHLSIVSSRSFLIQFISITFSSDLPADKQILCVSGTSSGFILLLSAGHHYSRAAFYWGGGGGILQ